MDKDNDEYLTVHLNEISADAITAGPIITDRGTIPAATLKATKLEARDVKVRKDSLLGILITLWRNII